MLGEKKHINFKYYFNLIKTVTYKFAMDLLIFVLILSNFNVFASPLIFGENSKSAFEGTKIPIIMYHRVYKENKSKDKWTISEKEFQSDLEYLKDNNYNAIVMSDLISYVNDGVALPNNPIMLTFDDGDISVFEVAYPLLKKYSVKAIISVIGSVTDLYSDFPDKNITYFPHLTWDQINEMKNSGLVEVQNHTYDMHKGKGAVAKSNESLTSHSKRLTADLKKFQERTTQMTDFTPTTLTYPFGAVDLNSEVVAREIGLKSSHSCYEKVNKVYVGNPDSLFRLGRFLRPPNKTSSSFFKNIEKVYDI